MDCPPGKVWNPVTAMCVQVHGKVGKSLVKKGVSAPAPETRVMQDLKDVYSVYGHPDRFDEAGAELKARGWKYVSADDHGRATIVIDSSLYGDQGVKYECEALLDAFWGNWTAHVYRTAPGQRRARVVYWEDDTFTQLETTPAEEALFKGTKEQRLHAYPRRGAAVGDVSLWTTHAYRAICDSMRGVKQAQPHIGKIVLGMKAYVKHTAAVVPAMPTSMGTGAPLALWRGVHKQTPPAVGSTVSSNGGCFTAFTHDIDIADGFATAAGAGGFLYRLQVDRIARGTPWIWLSASPRTRNARNVVSSEVEESEVLLPPGHFKILRRASGGADRPTPVYDIAFSPHPGYVRKGVLPTTERRAGGNVAVARTVGGDRLELRDAGLVENVRARLASLGLKTSTKTGGTTSGTTGGKRSPNGRSSLDGGKRPRL